MVMSNKPNGFTLIELMLAASLLMAILFSGYYGYSLYSTKWQKRVQTFWASSNQAIALSTITKMLTSMNSYIVKGSNDKPCVLFSGDNKKMTFVTDFPLYSSGSAVVSLEVIEANGGFNLIYKEQNLNNKFISNVEDFEVNGVWQKETILLSNLKDIHWSYFGWESFSDALKQSNITGEYENKDARKWYIKHDMNKVRVLPVSIKFKIKHHETLRISEWSIGLPNNTIYKLLASARLNA